LFKLSAAKKNSLLTDVRSRRATPANSEWEQSSIGPRIRKNSSKNEQTRSSIDHIFIKDRFMLGEKMAFVMIFWTAYIPFVILVLSLVGRHAKRALARLLGDGASSTLASPRAASAYISAQSRSTSRVSRDQRRT
jgi:hypothetical protein